jgi:hypothetical protein
MDLCSKHCGVGCTQCEPRAQKTPFETCGRNFSALLSGVEKGGSVNRFCAAVRMDEGVKSIVFFTGVLAFRMKRYFLLFGGRFFELDTFVSRYAREL